MVGPRWNGYIRDVARGLPPSHRAMQTLSCCDRANAQCLGVLARRYASLLVGVLVSTFALAAANDRLLTGSHVVTT